MFYTENYQTYDSFYPRAVWKLAFAWLPHRCEVTNKIIFWKYGYRGLAYYPNFDISQKSEVRWRDRHEHIIQLLKERSHDQRVF
jgi:hypothetical protein